MTARCRICGREWIVSIRQDTTGYVCPDCEYQGRMGREGIIKKEGENYSAATSPYDRNRPVDHRTSLFALNPGRGGPQVRILE